MEGECLVSMEGGDRHAEGGVWGSLLVKSIGFGVR